MLCRSLMITSSSPLGRHQTRLLVIFLVTANVDRSQEAGSARLAHGAVAPNHLQHQRLRGIHS